MYINYNATLIINHPLLGSSSCVGFARSIVKKKNDRVLSSTALHLLTEYRFRYSAKILHQSLPRWPLIFLSKINWKGYNPFPLYVTEMTNFANFILSINSFLIVARVKTTNVMRNQQSSFLLHSPV